MGLAGPLNVAVGAELRRENYQIGAGEPNSYAAGSSRDQFGNQAPLGAQVFPGFRPANEVDENRDNVAAYVDLEGNVVGRLRLGLAGRYEHYSDFGSTGDGKVTRALRAGHPPHPARRRQHRLPRPVAGPVVLLLDGDQLRQRARPGPGAVRVADHARGQPAGPGPRRRSRSSRSSRRTSAAAWSGTRSPPSRRRSTSTASRSPTASCSPATSTSPAWRTLLRPFGANSGRFFTNAIDTVTKGVEVTARYRFELGSAGRLGCPAATWARSAATATARTVLRHAHRGNDRHAAAARRIRGHAVRPHRAPPHRVRPAQGQIPPRRRLVEVAMVGLRSSRAATASSAASRRRSADDQIYGAKWLADVDVAYSHRRFSVHVGAQNLFDEFAGPEHACELVQRDPDLSGPQPVRDERKVPVRTGVAEVLGSISRDSGRTSRSHQRRVLARRAGRRPPSRRPLAARRPVLKTA